jgi:callose synthase
MLLSISLFLAFDDAMKDGIFSEQYKLNLLPKTHSYVITLVELLLQERKDQTKIVNTLQTLYVFAIHDFPRKNKGMEQLRQERLAPSSPQESSLLFEDVIKCPSNDDISFYK